MNQSHVRISWDAYLNNVSKEFSCLQQNAEFVDMTLAAEGHLVKVHKNIVAIASPYLKAMLQSIPCQHPVIFLNNVSHKILSYVLEYIYTGEVNLPPDIIGMFFEACRSLCIRGVDSITAPKITHEKQSEPQDKRVDNPPDNNFAACITINSIDNDYGLQVMSNENNVMPQIYENPLPFALPVPAVNFEVPNSHNFVIQNPKSSSNNTELSTNKTRNAIIISDEVIVAKHMPSTLDSSVMKINTNIKEDLDNIKLNDWKIQQPSQTESRDKPIQHPVNVTFNTNDYQENTNKSNCETHGDSMESSVNTEYLQFIPKAVNRRIIRNKKIKKIGSYAKDINPAKITLNKLNRIEMDKKAHYTISTRGSLQLLLNRFLYHSHHHAYGGRKRRWRCIDYRKMHCPACIDTDDDKIIAVMESHCHPDHDIQIRKKIKSNIVFTSLATAVTAIDKYLEEEKVDKNKSII